MMNKGNVDKKRGVGRNGEGGGLGEGKGAYLEKRE